MDLKIEIEIDGHEIVSSGTIMTIENKKLIFTIEDLKYVFEFKDNAETKENNITTNIQGKSLEVVFENFNNVLGSGNTEPVEMGRINDRRILFIFRIYALSGSKNKILHYTWLLEKGGKNVQ